MVPTHCLATLFTKARTATAWEDRAVDTGLLVALYDTLKWGPTSANSSPARLVFAASPEAKARLAACMAEGNRDKVLAAPVTAIVGMDLDFPATLGQLFPHQDARSWFEGNPDLIAATAMRNSSLQGAYLILAARALGLDCGPMSGFDAARIDAAFFGGTAVRANFVCSLGYGKAEALHPRLPRLDFAQACRIV